MKKLIFGLVLVMGMFFWQGCSYDEYYDEWKVEVTYLDGTIDTLQIEQISGREMSWNLRLKTYDPGVLVEAGIVPSLVLGWGFHEKTVVSGVRKFEILEHATRPAD